MSWKGSKHASRSGSYDQYWGGQSRQAYGGWRSSYGSQLQELDVEKDLEELLARLKHYDQLRVALEEEGGRLSDLQHISRSLSDPLKIASNGPTREVRLVDRASLAQALQYVHWDLHLEARFNSNRLPVFYLCRTKSDYWSEYSLIVEEYHVSPGYPMADERFVRLMKGGHDKHFLRVAHLRGQTAGLLAAGGLGKGQGGELDDKLHSLGRHVFQAAWHQDQQMGILTAKHFQLPRFLQAVEMLYLCLSGELCELRGAVDEFMLRFFGEVYAQPAISGLLSVLAGLEGKHINELPRLASSQYHKLGKAFSSFLSTQVAWGNGYAGESTLPLWKLIYANLNRLQWVAPALQQHQALNSAREKLEAEASEVVGNVMAVTA